MYGLEKELHSLKTRDSFLSTQITGFLWLLQQPVKYCEKIAKLVVSNTHRQATKKSMLSRPEAPSLQPGVTRYHQLCSVSQPATSRPRAAALPRARTPPLSALPSHAPSRAETSPAVPAQETPRSGLGLAMTRWFCAAVDHCYLLVTPAPDPTIAPQFLLPLPCTAPWTPSIQPHTSPPPLLWAPRLPECFQVHILRSPWFSSSQIPPPHSPSPIVFKLFPCF